MKKHKLSDLPYDYGALEPAISEKIMRLHHDKHHAGYVKKANSALEALDGDSEPNYKHVLRDLSFNLNGHLLHELFWGNMRAPQENNSPDDALTDQLAQRFGSFERFVEVFTKSAQTVEGSGWNALVQEYDGDDLQIIQIENHNKLYLTGYKIILIVDMWEHAYYLDYQNDRGKYLENWWSVVNWDVVGERLG